MQCRLPGLRGGGGGAEVGAAVCSAEAKSTGRGQPEMWLEKYTRTGQGNRPGTPQSSYEGV